MRGPILSQAHGGAEINVAAIVDRVLKLWTFGVLLLIVLAFSLTTTDFLSQESWLAISVSATEVMILALGQTFVIISGGVDLSVGAVLAAAGMTGGVVMRSLAGTGSSPTTIIVLGGLTTLAVGLFAGVVNGLVITRLRVMPFIATLGMFGVATGAANLANGGQDIANIPQQILKIGNTNLLGNWVPIPVLITVVLSAIAWAFLQRTRFGRRTFAIGSNRSAARRAGININRHLVIVYAMSGLCAGVSSFLVIARLGTASVTSGTGDELTSIAVVVIGGGSLLGGRGSIGGAVIGTMIVAVLDVGLIIAGVQPFWQSIAVGVILVAAVSADQQRIRLEQSAAVSMPRRSLGQGLRRTLGRQA